MTSVRRPSSNGHPKKIQKLQPPVISHMMFLLIWWSCRLDTCFFNNCGLAWSTTSGPVSTLYLIVRPDFVLVLGSIWGAHGRGPSALTGNPTQVPTVVSTALYLWALPLSRYPANPLPRYPATPLPRYPISRIELGEDNSVQMERKMFGVRWEEKRTNASIKDKTKLPDVLQRIKN